MNFHVKHGPFVREPPELASLGWRPLASRYLGRNLTGLMAWEFPSPVYMAAGDYISLAYFMGSAVQVRRGLIGPAGAVTDTAGLRRPAAERSPLTVPASPRRSGTLASPTTEAR